MRRFMLTLAVVLGVAVIRVEAQHHEPEAPAKKAAAKGEGEKGEGEKGTGEKGPAEANKPKTGAAPSVGELAERIGHVAVVIDSRRGRVMPVRERVSGTRQVSGAKDASEAKEPKRATRAASSAEPVEENHASEKAPARVELDWHMPLLVWPEELLQPRDEPPASH
jgi:hypothetical protein